MCRNIWSAILLTTFGAFGSGCLSVRDSGYEEAMRPCPPHEAPTPIRQQAYLFMVNGADVLELAGMLELRDRLSVAGFSKVYYIQQIDVKWYQYEMRRVHRDEPGARILLLGYGTGAAKVHQLAAEAARDRLPLDSVIFLDPVGLSGNLAETLPTNTVVVRSHNWRGGSGLVGTENWTATGVGHVALPTHDSTVQNLLRLMTNSARSVVLDDHDRLPHLSLRDDKMPTPRPIDPATLKATGDEWDFLKSIPSHPWYSR